MTLGQLVQQARESVTPPLTQSELGAIVGLDQRSISSIEKGRVLTLTPQAANRLVASLPLSMADLLRAMGYNLPVESGVPEDIFSGLECAPPGVLDAVRMLLRGYQRSSLVSN